MAQDDHLAGPFCFSGKRLITITIKILSIIIPIAILAHFFTVLHSFNFSVPSSLLFQFVAIFAAFTLFFIAIEPPLSLDGAVA